MMSNTAVMDWLRAVFPRADKVEAYGDDRCAVIERYSYVRVTWAIPMRALMVRDLGELLANAVRPDVAAAEAHARVARLPFRRRCGIVRAKRVGSR